MKQEKEQFPVFPSPSFASVTRVSAISTDSTSAFTLHGVRQVKEETTLLDAVDLEIRHGEITALVGPSGAGKTSLLRLLNRLDDPVSGEVLYHSRPIKDYSVQELRRKVGFVFQTPVMFPGTVLDNLSIALMLAKENMKDPDERIIEAMELAELDRALYDRDGEKLSGGQKQRANIARALLTSPEVLLMDEPTSALDPETADRLMETIRRLSKEKHLTVVMVTHRLSEARRTSDTTIVMERGRVGESGRTTDVFAHPANPRIRAFLDGEK